MVGCWTCCETWREKENCDEGCMVGCTNDLLCWDLKNEFCWAGDKALDDDCLNAEDLVPPNEAAPPPPPEPLLLTSSLKLMFATCGKAC